MMQKSPAPPHSLLSEHGEQSDPSPITGRHDPLTHSCPPGQPVVVQSLVPLPG